MTYWNTNYFSYFCRIQMLPIDMNNEIILYQPDTSVSLEVRLEDDTVWLNRIQIETLFDRDVKTIGKHINNALQEELVGLPTVAKFAIVSKRRRKNCCFQFARRA